MRIIFCAYLGGVALLSTFSCIKLSKMGKHWVDGRYAFKGTPWFCNEVKGEVAFWRNLSEFDHPELNANPNGMEGIIRIIFCPNQL